MEKPFLYKYQPTLLNEYEMNENIKLLLQSLLDADCISTLFVGDSGSGKSSLINTIINEYYGKGNIMNNENHHVKLIPY